MNITRGNNDGGGGLRHFPPSVSFLGAHSHDTFLKQKQNLSQTGFAIDSSTMTIPSPDSFRNPLFLPLSSVFKQKAIFVVFKTSSRAKEKVGQMVNQGNQGYSQHIS